MKSFKNNTRLVISEIEQSLLNVSPKQTQLLVDQIVSAQRVFLVAIGRVQLSLQLL